MPDQAGSGAYIRYPEQRGFEHNSRPHKILIPVMTQGLMQYGPGAAGRFDGRAKKTLAPYVRFHADKPPAVPDDATG